MKQWVNLHNHTTFSMLDGHSNVKAYAKRAQALGMPAATITDHGNLHGWLDFYDACCDKDGEVNIKPILGLEAYQARKTRFDRDEEERAGPAKNEWDQRGPYHLTILAKNMAGYKNLIKLSSRSFLEGYYVKPRIDMDLLDEHSDGLIVLSGCLNGAIQQALLRGDEDAALLWAATMMDTVGPENFFIEIQDHHLPEQLAVKKATLDIAKRIGAKVVPTGDCHYVHKEDAPAHDAMLCVSTNATMDQENRFKFNGANFYLKSYEEMEKLFEPEWLKNSLDVADMIDVEPKFGELYFPEFPLPEGTNKDTYLEERVWAGVRERYGDPLPDEVRERTVHELGVVQRMGFGDYFLVVSDLVNWAKNNGIRVGWGRGSAAGSILSYALRITNLDPVKYGLMFERFLVEGRKSMPDIDLDFDDRFRDKVINYAREKYGADRVVHIATFSQVGAKSAIRDAARVLGFDFTTGDKIAKMVPDPVLGVSKTLEEALRTTDMALAYKSDPTARRIIDTAKGLEGVHRQPGIHAAGVVISQAPTMEFVPLMVGGKNKDTVVTQWDMHGVERCGQLKIDFLGLRNLGVIDMCIENIKKSTGEVVDIDDLDIEDAKTYEELRAGNAVGVFQLESPGMKEMMLSLKPEDIFDVMALISLYRPGPLGSGMDKMFINRKHKREKVSYVHPALKEVLAPSYGIMLYQEDVLAVARELAGFSVPEADDLRKAIGKKEMDKIGKFRKAFVEGSKKTNNVDARVADKVYSDIEYFGGYGFNRAHAISYAMVSYVTGYLKAHYPAEYMAALLSSVAASKDKLALYLNECRKMSISVLSPSVTESEAEFKVKDGEILFGLSAIDGVGPAIVSAILTSQNKDYNNIYEYLRLCDPAILNKKILENLTGAGAFDELLPFESVKTLERKDRLEILEFEKSKLGIYVTDHPLLGVWDYLGNQTSTTITDLEGSSNGDKVKLAGIISAVTKKTTKKGAKMFLLTFEDLAGSLEVIVFPKDADKLADDFFESGTIGFLEGTVSREGDEENSVVKLYYNSIEKLDTSTLHGSRPIVLKSKAKLSAHQLERISGIIERVNGDSTVYIENPEGNHKVVLKFKKKTSLEVEELLQQIVDIGSSEFEF